MSIAQHIIERAAAGLDPRAQRSVGIHATTTALQTAAPAASNPGAVALVGSAAPYAQYVSNGSAWSPVSGDKFALGRMGRRVSILSNSYATPFGGGFFYDFVGASNGALIADTIAGVGGNKTADMLARVDSIPSTTEVCLIHEAPNDSAASVTPPAQIWARGSSIRKIRTEAFGAAMLSTTASVMRTSRVSFCASE